MENAKDVMKSYYDTKDIMKSYYDTSTSLHVLHM